MNKIGEDGSREEEDKGEGVVLVILSGKFSSMTVYRR